jgi:DNA-binding transcriptional MerR regulator
MGSYSIKELETMTGIKAHTIRIWEQRYDIMEPSRTETNVRFYSDEDLRNLITIAFLNKHGFKISKLSEMSQVEMTAHVLKLTEHASDTEGQINALLLGMIHFDEAKIEFIVNQCTTQFGFEDTVLKVLFPFLAKVGVLWQTSLVRPAQEHFISNLIRQKIIAATDRIPTLEDVPTKRFILFLPEKEMHEISLLFINYLIRSRGCYTLYLGANVPFEDIISVYEEINPDYLVTVLTAYPNLVHAIDYLNKLTNLTSNSKVIVSGKQLEANEAPIPKNVHHFKEFSDLITFLNKFKVNN